ncbi:rod shape-determining protein MreD [Virgibacillus byunsanensis]|uniref:Rod shape-determining protein MreD n=1 Tax=Virgibacillus byunsanensis TaxID=570945 RepID=A0ABW3LMZ3_9BACI
MKRLYVPLILFLLVVIEGVALKLLPANLVMGNSFIIPHWVFVFLVFVAIFYDKEDTNFGVIYGLIFGLLIDIVYTGILGVYMFTYAVTIYIIQGLKKVFHANIYVTLCLGIVGLIIAEVTINVIFLVIGISEMVWKDYLLYRLLPTLLANIVFILILYPLITRLLIKWREEQLYESDTF